MTEADKNEIILKAAIQLSPEHIYTVRYGTLGLTLYVEVHNPNLAKEARKKIPMEFEGLRTIVIRRGSKDEYDIHN